MLYTFRHHLPLAGLVGLLATEAVFVAGPLHGSIGPTFAPDAPVENADPHTHGEPLSVDSGGATTFAFAGGSTDDAVTVLTPDTIAFVFSRPR